MDKVVASPKQAIADIPDGATIAIAGFSVAHRFANSLILALREKGTKNLTLVCNSLGDPGRDARADPRGEQTGQEARSRRSRCGRARRPRASSRSRHGRDGGRARAAGNSRRALPRGRRRHTGFLFADERRHRPRRRAARSASSTASRTCSSTRSIVDYALLPRLSRGPPRQRAVPRRQPELQSELRESGEVRDRRSRRDRRAGRDPAGAHRSARHLREARREDDAGRGRQGVAAVPSAVPPTSRGSTTTSPR